MTTSKYRVVFIITLLLLSLSIALSFLNYSVSMQNAKSQLKNQSLPLSLDNIYTVIQKHIIEPSLISSMMANDTFLHDWLHHEKSRSVNEVRQYLGAIQQRYGMFNTFLVSDITKNYYTHEGFVEKVSAKRPRNQWYYDFKLSAPTHEINLDHNENFSNELIMFINHKIFDHDRTYLGTTGVAMNLSYIDGILRDFRTNHNFVVTFFDKEGKVVLAERNEDFTAHIDDFAVLSQYKDEILSPKSSMIEYKQYGSSRLLTTKYIPELNLFLSVEAKLSDFTKDVKKVLILNVAVSIMITLIVAFIIYYLIKNYSRKLEFYSSHDPLTKLPNRRDFEQKFKHHIALAKRDAKPHSILFLDIDDFKAINDSFGHATGDRVICQIARILENTLRKTDLVARWGGEEFIAALIDCDSQMAVQNAQKILQTIKQDAILVQITGRQITASIGVSTLRESDTLDSIISRADDAMYAAKNSGKNKVTCYK